MLSYLGCTWLCTRWAFSVLSYTIRGHSPFLRGRALTISLCIIIILTLLGQEIWFWWEEKVEQEQHSRVQCRHQLLQRSQAQSQDWSGRGQGEGPGPGEEGEAGQKGRCCWREEKGEQDCASWEIKETEDEAEEIENKNLPSTINSH